MKRLVGNKKFVVAVLLVLLLSIGLAGYKFMDNDKPDSSEENVVYEDDSKFLAEQEKYGKVLRAYNDKKWQETIDSAKEFAASEAHDTTLRLTALDTCMRAANELKDSAAKEECFNKAKSITESLENADEKSGWQQQLEKTNSGSAGATGDSSGPQ